MYQCSQKGFPEARKMNCYALTNSPMSNHSRANYYMNPSRKYCKLWIKKKISGSVKLYINNPWGKPAYLWNGSHFSIFFIMADANILFLLAVGKSETKTLEGLVIWNLFVQLNIYKMVGIFWFFHNGWCQYSVSVNIQRPKLCGGWGGRLVSNLKFFCMAHIYKMAATFWFFHNGRCHYFVLQKPDTSDYCWRFIYLTKQHT